MRWGRNIMFRFISTRNCAVRKQWNFPTKEKYTPLEEKRAKLELAGGGGGETVNRNRTFSFFMYMIRPDFNNFTINSKGK